MSDSDRIVDRRTVLGGVGVSLVGLAGCNGLGGDSGGDGGGDGGGGESIEVTGVWADEEEENFQAVIDYVEGETGLEIEYHPRNTDSLLTGTLMDYESGVAPADIVVMPSPARIRSDAENGHLEPIGNTWNPEDFAVEPDHVSVGRDVYAAPFKMDHKPGFWYRQSFFEEHGLSEPGNYDEFLNLLGELDGIDGVDAPLASGNGDGWPLSDLAEAFILRQENGDQLQEGLVVGDAEFTDERVAAALRELQSLLQEGYFSELRDFGVQYEYFWENRLPLYFMGSWTPGFEAIQDPEDLGVFRLPGTNGIVASVNWFTVPAYSENAEAAQEAVGTFVSAEGQQVWAERGGFIASNTNVPAEAYGLDIMAQLPEMAAETNLVPDLDDSLGNPFQEEFWSQLSGLWTNPNTDIDAMVERLAEEHQETLASEGENQG